MEKEQISGKKNLTTNFKHNYLAYDYCELFLLKLTKSSCHKLKL